MKKNILKPLAILSAVGILSVPLSLDKLSVNNTEVNAAAAVKTVDIYRLYNPNSGEHFYTRSSAERNNIIKAGWKYEGIGWVAPETSSQPIYRLYNPNAGDHFYTTSSAEKNSLVKVGWRYEGINSYASTNSKDIALLRAYNPNAKAGSHNYTTSSAEQNSLIKAGWKNENIAWRVSGLGHADASVPAVTPKHVDQNITGTGGSETSNPGSYRNLYSNRPFDSATLTGNPTIEYSANIKMTSSSSDYETQFVIAGTNTGQGQIGISLHYQAGTDANFAQGRINTTTINFPSGAGNTGQQYYSVNTGAARIANGQTVNLKVKYFSNGYMQAFVNNVLVGQYKTSLATNSAGNYILHTLSTNATVNMSNIKVLKNGTDITHGGPVPFKNSSYSLGSGIAISAAY
ncbi:hypothetical protein [Pseudolactococcus insecticola]|uniref:DUF5648 domain-containing protein n=1 Tax=Pseudolactococcus insecticola TaxID=2709158 RepID=A0A6A0B3Y5_9LACT|nr:hypothetical protein [Lactococcus insecticola]GFH39872.1 hypothetical protein Hs20B_02700 [Lactococcus insecticola]